MPSGSRVPRAAWYGVGAALIAVVAVLVVAAGLALGWFDPGSVEGDTRGFRADLAPRGDADASAWPEYGLDQRRTRSNTALPLAPPFRKTWTVDAGSLLEFPPVLAHGALFVGSNAGLALSVDAATGRVRWRRALRGRVASSPALAGREVLFTTIAGDLIALDRTTGEERWRLRLGTAVESSPLVLDGSAYVGTLDGRVLRVDLRRRRAVWSARASGDVKASLAAVGDAVVVGDYGGTVTAYARRDGRVRWRRTSPGPSPGPRAPQNPRNRSPSVEHPPDADGRRSSGQSPLPPPPPRSRAKTATKPR